MKKLLPIICCWFIISESFAQWQSELQLTVNPAISALAQSNARSISVKGDTLHVVWFDTRDGNAEIYYKRSVDQGLNWTTDTRITNDPANSTDPSIVVEGSSVYIVWADTRDGNNEIYLIRSTDGGLNWGQAARVTNTSGTSLSPTLCASSNILHLVWNEGNSVLYTQSLNFGGMWNSSTTIMSLSGRYFNAASMAISGQTVAVVSAASYQGITVYFRRSTTGGIGWDNLIPFSDTSASYTPNISISGQLMHVFWADNRNGKSVVYYKRSADLGFSWGANQTLSTDTADAYYPNSASSNNGNTVALNWVDNRNGNDEIYFRHSEDGGLSWNSGKRITNNSAISSRPCVALNGAKAYMVFVDERTADTEIYLTYNGNVVTRVDERDIEKITLSPNPATDQLTITADNKEPVTVSVYNTTGVLMRSFEKPSSEPLTI